MTIFNEDAYFTLKALQKGPPTKKHYFKWKRQIYN